MVLSLMVPYFTVIGSRGVPPVPPTILMSGMLLGGNITHPPEVKLVKTWSKGPIIMSGNFEQIKSE
jgi:hypothetical protein